MSGTEREGDTCIPAATGGKGGWLSSWHTGESGNKHTDRERRESRRTDGKRGVERRRFKPHTNPPCSSVVKPNSPLTLPTHFLNLQMTARAKLCVCPESSLFTCYCTHTDDRSDIHISITHEEICMYIKCTWQTPQTRQHTHVHSKHISAAKVNEDRNRTAG